MSIDKQSDTPTDERFLSRWARVKHRAQAHEMTVAEQQAGIAPIGDGVQDTCIGGPLKPEVSEEVRPEATLPGTPVPDALPSLDSLTPQSDFSPFMARDVDPQLRNLAMKKLFTDPHYNVMDRLDIYIDDYSTHPPLSLDIIRQMSISKTLGLFDDEEEMDATGKISTAQPHETVIPQLEQVVAPPSPVPVEGVTRDEAEPVSVDAVKGSQSEQRREST